MCILGRDRSRSIPKISQSLTNISQTVQEMSDGIRVNFNDFPTLIKALYSDKKMQISIDTKINAQICGKINLEAKIENPVDPIIAEIDEIEPEEPEIKETRTLLETQLQLCSAKSISELTPWKNYDHAFKIALLNSEQEPIACKSRPLPFHLKKKVKQALDDQERAGIIRKSHSNWAFALRVVPKPDFTIRITVDYKPLNKIIKFDKYPKPSVADLYSKLGQEQFFYKIDMKAAYHQIPMHPESIPLTAFICEFGLYEYLSIPVKISSAPAWFQRFIDAVVQDFMIRETPNVYLDDIILFSASLEYHEKEDIAVMERIKERNI